MARRTGEIGERISFPRSRTFGTAATSARHRLGWLWGRDSSLRLGLSLILAVALWLYVTGRQNPAVVAFGEPLQVATELAPGLTVLNALPAVHLQVRLDNPAQIPTTSSFRAYVNLLGLGPKVYRNVPVHVDALDPRVHVVTISPRTVAVQIDRLTQKPVPVQARTYGSQPEGYGLGTVQVNPSSLNVSGPQSLVNLVARAEVEVVLTNVSSTFVSSLTPVLQDSQGLEVAASTRLNISPASVTVTVPVRPLGSYKTVPLLAKFEGRPKAGYGVAGVSVSPTDITASGTPRVLGALTTLPTSPVSIAGRGAGRIRQRVVIHFPHGVSSRVTHAVVTVDLKPVQVSTSIQVGIILEGVAPGLQAKTQNYVLVTVVGPLSRIESAARNMRALINLSGFGQGTFLERPTVSPPPGLSVENVYPATVTVSIQPAPSG